MPDLLRVGLAGCGYQGHCLATALGRTTTFSLVACADPDQEAAATVAALSPRTRPFSSVEALLEATSLDALLVATPHHLLRPVSLAALRAGKHVLAEKPCGLDEQEAAAVQQEARRADVRYMAGYSCRFSLGRHVHDLLAAGAVGDIQAITGTMGCGPLNEGWAATAETGGGPLLFLGSHLVDLVLWFMDDEPVGASGRVRRRAGSDVDETSAFQIYFSRGPVAQCLVTQAASTFFFTVDIHGRAGRIVLRGSGWSQFEIEVSSTVDAAFSEPVVTRPGPRDDHISTMLVPELEEFASAISDRREPSVGATDARRVLRVLDAVVAADRSGASVRIG